MACTVLRISDGEHTFPFLFDGPNIYCPDYNPTAYGKSPDYALTIIDGGPFGSKVWPVNFGHKDFIACIPFRHEGHNYHQYIPTGCPFRGNKYVCLQAWKNGAPDPDYTSVQESHIVDVAPFAISVVFNKFGICINGVRDELETMFKENYAYKDSTINISAEVACLDEDDMYWKSDTATKWSGGDFLFKLQNWPFTLNHQYKDDLRIVGIMHVEIVHKDGSRMHIDLRSNPFQITPEQFAQMLALAHGPEINLTDLDKMNVAKPYIVNKSVYQVTEMTSQTDSKSNIVQPVFFRARDLANIIVHPEVTENICINLDAYKAKVTTFHIKIEGTTFTEIGRTESGVIFKVQGNLLPGKLAGGVYYILDQDANLVTTGKYIYER